MDFKNISDLFVKYFYAIMDIVIFFSKIVVSVLFLFQSFESFI